MRMRFLLLLLLLSASLIADIPVIRLQTDSLNATLGDVLDLTWEVVPGDVSDIRIPHLPEEFGAFHILDQRQDRHGGEIELQIQTGLYDSTGYFRFPSFQIYFANRDSLWDSTSVSGPTVLIHSVLTAADTTFRPIKDIHQIRLPWNWSLILLIVLLLGILGLAIWLVGRRLGKAKAAAAAVVHVTPEEAHVRALRELRVLGQSGMLQEGNFRPYYSRLTYILRLYFEDRFRFGALESTTAEILEYCRNTGILEEEYQKMTREILEQSDLVKFARHRPPVSAGEQNLRIAIQVVEGTRILKEEEIELDESKEVQID